MMEGLPKNKSSLHCDIDARWCDLRASDMRPLCGFNFLQYGKMKLTLDKGLGPQGPGARRGRGTSVSLSMTTKALSQTSIINLRQFSFGI